MKITPLVVAGAIAASAPAAFAAPYHHHHGYYRGHVYVAPYYPRYYYPFSFYFAPFVAAPIYVYPPVVERRYVEPPPPRPVLREPRVPQYSQEERSRAEIKPQPAPLAAATPSRLERYTLSAKELFEFDKAELRMPQPKLDEIAEALKANPFIQGVNITGYTDRLGSSEYNLKLSQRRADVVKSYLVHRGGLDPNRLHAVGKGEADPVVHCDDEDRAKLIQCLEPNRRVEVDKITVEVREKS